MVYLLMLIVLILLILLTDLLLLIKNKQTLIAGNENSDSGQVESISEI